MIICFVDIGGIVGYHCLNFLFSWNIVENDSKTTYYQYTNDRMRFIIDDIRVVVSMNVSYLVNVLMTGATNSWFDLIFGV